MRRLLVLVALLGCARPARRPRPGRGAGNAGAGTSCARLRSGRARCWGRGEICQLGDDSFDPRALLPVAVTNPTASGRLTAVRQLQLTAGTTCVRVVGGTARCWGYGLTANLGNGGNTDSPRPVIVLPGA